MSKCNTCNLVFNKEQLERHIKICQKYKNIIFTCKICNFSCESDIKIINNHIQEKCEKHNKIIPNELQEQIDNLTLSLQIEQTKIQIYSKIIEKNLNIKLDEKIYENNGKLIIKQINIPIIIENSEQQEKTPEKQPKKGKIFRPLKKMINTDFIINEDEIQHTINKIDDIIKDLSNEFKPTEELENAFNKIFETLKTTKTYNPSLQKLVCTRKKSFGIMKLENYLKLIQNHLDIITNIFKEKNYSDKKIQNILNKALSPLEARLFSQTKYYETFLEYDEINLFDTHLNINTYYPKEYIPFCLDKIYNNFYNYGSVIFSIKKTMERYLLNIYNFNNLIYVPLQKSSDEDPYSFYSLETITNEKRCWKMECRLEDIANNISLHFIPYLISIFRKLYKEIFGDNDYRNDYKNHCHVTENDLEQLAQNILFISKPREFRNLLCKIIKEKSTYNKITELDKFNLTGDDILQKKRLQNKDDIDIADTVKLLFDNINSEQAVDFYRLRSIS
jgi:hypothetical protein